MFTIGTAGHVDHGKSALVKALTGIDPDRLQEEKDRGMTIDLGFAWLKLPGGQEVSIVDVPGHERFIKNMLAGVGGIDLALLVVAADEGVMPQTREHLAILDLLKVQKGLVALTKVDLVDADWVEMVREEVEAVLVGTQLEGSPILAVSALTGAGLPELAISIEELLSKTPKKRDLGRPRLPIDRVFTIAGFGTVVTGTLIDGRLQIGQEVDVLPRGLRTRVRGLQTHRHKVEEAEPGARVAANLASLSVADLHRGDVVTLPRAMRPTRTLDASLRVLNGAPHSLPHGTTVSFHTGASETLARVILLDQEELAQGETGWAQFRLDEAIVVAKGDLFVIRSPDTTLGGGEVVEPHARRHKRFQAAITASLDTLAKGSPEQLVLAAASSALDASAIANHAGLPKNQVNALLIELSESDQMVRLGNLWLATPAWQILKNNVVQVLDAYHKQFPLREGMPREELRSRLKASAKLFLDTIGKLIHDGDLAEGNSLLHLPTHQVHFNPVQEKAIALVVAELRHAGYSPPDRLELERIAGLESEALAALIQKGDLIKVSEDLIYLPETIAQVVERVNDFIISNASITIAEIRDLLGTSRKYALALATFLDEQKITRRVGDTRVRYGQTPQS